MSSDVPIPRWFLLVGALLILCIAAGALLVAIPGRTQATQPRPGSDSADAGFARDMAVHHQQAVEMSFLVRDSTTDEDVRRLAFDVITTQSNQRGMMLGWLDMWDAPKIGADRPMRRMEDHVNSEEGVPMPGMAPREQLDRLRVAKGRAAEVLYLQLMIPHHQGGLVMAKAAVKQARNRQVLALAESVVRAQQSEIRLMRDMLTRRGAPRTEAPAPTSAHH